MKTAIVTGAGKGIGQALTRRLINLDYKVYGLSRTFDTSADPTPDGSFSLADQNRFIAVSCDLLDTSDLVRKIEAIIREEPRIDLLVNNAGVGFFGPHEQLTVQQIQTMTRTNLEVPLILAKLLLRPLKDSQGTFLSISSAAARKISTHGCAYAATKAGLAHFSASLFEEIRKAGVKVVTLLPDMTESHFYDKLDFSYAQESDAYILADQVADALEYVLQADRNLVVEELVLRPQKNRIIRKKPQI